MSMSENFPQPFPLEECTASSVPEDNENSHKGERCVVPLDEDGQKTMEGLYEKYESLFRYITSMGASYEGAQDAVSDAIVLITEKVANGSLREINAMYIFSAARNAYLSTCRRSQKVPFVPLDVTVHDPSVPGPETMIVTRMLLEEIFAQLTQKEAAAMRLFYIHNWEVKDIAEKLGVTEDTIKMRLWRGRERFKSIFNRVDSPHDADE